MRKFFRNLQVGCKSEKACKSCDSSRAKVATSYIVRDSVSACVGAPRYEHNMGGRNKVEKRRGLNFQISAPLIRMMPVDPEALSVRYRG